MVVKRGAIIPALNQATAKFVKTLRKFFPSEINISSLFLLLQDLTIAGN